MIVSVIPKRIGTMVRKTRTALFSPWQSRLPSYAPALGWFILAVTLFVGVFLPSYTHPPAHYARLRRLCEESNIHGRGNPSNEKVFVVSSLYDPNGSIIQGGMGSQILGLIDLLGKDNVFLSIYENDINVKGESALKWLGNEAKCNNTVVLGKHVAAQLHNSNNVTLLDLPDGTKRMKRTAYLAEVRNRALRPLDEMTHAGVQYDKLLFLNDVNFDPINAAQLLFSTNRRNDNGNSIQYRAACALDFDNPFKFYDTYATRDLDGYSMGVPFYPWFSTAGRGDSRQDVFNQKDAVRVRSCWGGMVAFDASYFQGQKRDGGGNVTQKFAPLKFRAEKGGSWEASECCLIQADIQELSSSMGSHQRTDGLDDSGIYMNPYIRVAYSSGVFAWLSLSRRFERLFSVPQAVLSWVAGLPRFNLRRLVKTGDTVYETSWQPPDGKWVTKKAKSGPGGFCGRPVVQVMIPRPKPGKKKWEELRF